MDRKCVLGPPFGLGFRIDLLSVRLGREIISAVGSSDFFFLAVYDLRWDNLLSDLAGGKIVA